MTRNSRSLVVLLSLCATIVAALATTSTAGAARNVDYGFVEDQFGDNLLTNANAAISNEWWDKNKKTNSDVVRVNLYWSQVAGPIEPADPTNPRDPRYDWSVPDAALLNAKRRGIDVVFTVFLAPRWAEGPNRPASEDVSRIGTWRPDPDRFRDFAEAVATRYSGKFDNLPQVKYFEGWNEPNLPQYITPQWDGKRPVSSEIYRELINGFYEGIKAGNAKAKVIAGGTSPFGDDPGGRRMRPYYFWRQVLCLKNRKKLKKKSNCVKGEDRAHFDIYGQNAINGTRGEGPTSKSPHPDYGVPSNFKDLGKIVKAAERQRTVLPKLGKGRPGWVTETWYESNPPEKRAVSLKRQAAFMQQALYVLWKQKARTVFFLQLRDTPYDPSAPRLVGFQTGVYLPNGKPKPSLKAAQFPFVGDRQNKRKVLIWGIAPKSGKLTIKDSKKKLKKVRVKKSKVFTTTIRLKKSKKKHKLRGKVRSKKSLAWVQR
jgi:hypothetical protein